MLVLFLTCGLVQPETAPAQDHSDNAAVRVVEVNIKGAGKVRIPDLVLHDQEGRKVRFYSDLIKGKVVVLSFFYTNCT